MNEAEDSGESVLFFNIISIPPFLLSPYLLRISVQLLIFLLLILLENLLIGTRALIKRYQSHKPSDEDVKRVWPKTRKYNIQSRS